MVQGEGIRATPAHMRACIGFACICAWGVVTLLKPIFGSAVEVIPAGTSMLPGLITCLVLIFVFRAAAPPPGRTVFTCASAVIVAAGTLLCTMPATAAIAATRAAGLALSGLFAIVLVVSWFQEYARMRPRTVIVLSGCAITVAAGLCWAILLCPDTVASALASALPLAAAALLPAGRPGAAADVHAALQARDVPAVREVVSEAAPLRTLLGIGISFFVVSSVGVMAPRFGLFSESVSPLSLLVALGVSLFFVASAHLVHDRFDSSILYKVLLTAFAAIILLLAFSVGVSASLLLYANIIADVMMWTVLALWSKKTPVQPHLVFAVAWIAECLGDTLGQLVGTALSDHPAAFFVVAIVLILLAVGFAFSEGSLMLDVEPELRGGTGAADGAAGAGCGATRADAAAGSKANDADGAAGTDGAAAPKTADGAAGETSGTSAGAVAAPEAAATTVEATGAGAPAGAMGGTVPATPSAEGALAAFGRRHALSPREQEVFELWVTGHGLKHIEQALFISEATVKSHLRHIYRKCDTHSRAQIIDLFEREQREGADPAPASDD